MSLTKSEPMSSKQAERWEQTRSRGKARYVLTFGGVVGGTVFLGGTLWDLTSGRPLGSPEGLVGSLVLAVAIGSLTALWMWSWGERRFGEYRARSESPKRDRS